MGDGSRGTGLFRKLKAMDQYFLTEKCPFSQKRKIKTKNVKIAAIGVTVLLVFALLFFGRTAEQEQKQAQALALKSEDVQKVGTLVSASPEGSITVGGNWDKGGVPGTMGRIWRPGGGRGFSGESNRQYSASQIVKGSLGGAGGGFGLPMGSTIQARLTNTLLSSDSNQPVIAEVLEDAVWRNSILIPAGARAIGSASFDNAARRLQIRFHTLVYPEGDQHPVSALALIVDGSSGLPGDYHGGATKKEVGRFLGNFTGGLADGMKERQAAGQSGIAFEPGSLRNGILNAISVSAMDQAKALSESMQESRPYLEVPGGAAFSLYFEKEYLP